ncbi:tRNA (cytosine(38)-C(5))-methyltransferase [Grifola frondosa]|uniref:tRNA (Cytosine(38)-C(5))-methyltransferase n=1 Tax=Grifola frondosa TaxID=5627 RepID=A0A1C7MS33_GRIFR|nr:tRNA (cytosine(38)-C(5))-methyltransferase [Grifola frondosa]
MTVVHTLEFYSGIGGLHRALLQSDVDGTVIRGFDWDQSACRVYEANYGSNIVQKVDISMLFAPELASFHADLWLLSPSCQPYTVLNPLAKELVSMNAQPKYMLVENVAGFETSSTRRRLLTRGIREIRQFLDPDDTQLQHCAIPDQVLKKWGRLFDIVLPSARRSCCFTRGYAKMAERSGSVLQLNEELDTTTTFNQFMEAQNCGDEDAVRILDPLRLRYFSPTELLRLFCFPSRSRDDADDVFCWPDEISMKTRYRLIGNSVNCTVGSGENHSDRDIPNKHDLARTLLVCSQLTFISTSFYPKSSLVLYSTISSHFIAHHDIFCENRGFMLRPPIAISRHKRLFHPNPLISTR